MRFFSTDPVLKKTEAFEDFFCFASTVSYNMEFNVLCGEYTFYFVLSLPPVCFI